MPIVFKVLKFSLVGFVGMLIDFGATYLLKEKLGIDRYLSNAIGFALAATNNFYWNKVWTFQNDSAELMEQYLSFIAISIIGLLINTFFLVMFERRLKITFYYSKFLAIVAVTIWNFTMNYFVTFSF